MHTILKTLTASLALAAMGLPVAGEQPVPAGERNTKDTMI